MGEQNGAFPFEADADSSVPLWVQLRKRIVYLIGSGYFKPGAQGGEVEAVLVDCLLACRNLGLSYDEAVAQMTRRAMRLKMAEAQPQRAGDSNIIVLAPEGEGAAGAGAGAAAGGSAGAGAAREAL